MSIRSSLAIVAVSALVPVTAFAAECGNYVLTEAQQAFLEGQPFEIPQGEVPVIQRCDVNDDNVVDINDIRAISMHRNQPAAHPDDPMDWDRNSVINVLDARGCQQVCALPRCATPSEPPPPEEPQMGGVFEAAECSQTTDLDGDGVDDDFVGVFEHTGEEQRSGGWTLEVVIMTEDESGNVEAVTFPYTGQNATETGGIVSQHLSKQPAGVVDLNPGTLMLDEPAVVAYRNGQPKVVYYIVNGVVNQSFFGIDD